MRRRNRNGIMTFVLGSALALAAGVGTTLSASSAEAGTCYWKGGQWAAYSCGGQVCWKCISTIYYPNCSYYYCPPI